MTPFRAFIDGNFGGTNKPRPDSHPPRPTVPEPQSHARRYPPRPAPNWSLGFPASAQSAARCPWLASSRRDGSAHSFPHQNPQRLHSVPPGQLFTGLATARLVADRNLIRPNAGTQNLARDLGLHSESGRLHVETSVHRQWHELEAGFEVADIDIEQNIGRRRHEPITQNVKVGKRVVAAERSGSVHDFSLTVEDRLQQRRDLFRSV